MGSVHAGLRLNGTSRNRSERKEFVGGAQPEKRSCT